MKCLTLIWFHYYVVLFSVKKKGLRITRNPNTSSLHSIWNHYARVKSVTLFHVFFFSPQEISRTYFRTCLKDHAGVDGQRDNLEVHFVVIGGDECKRDNLMIIFLNFIVVVPLSLVLLFSRALEQGNQTRCTYKNDYLSVSWQHTKGPLISILLDLRFKLNYYRSLWVGACNSTIFLSRRFHRPIYF